MWYKKEFGIRNKYSVVYRVGIALGVIGGGVLTWFIKLKAIF